MEKENYIMKPLILLTGGTGAAANGTPTWALNQNYAENIRRAGGIPILAVNNDCAEEYADLADGLLLSGGKDVEPKLYGQEKMFDFVITDPQRDDLEYKIIKAFVDRRKPIWGICRGIQIMNVAAGGTLYQDLEIEGKFEHHFGDKYPRNYPWHDLKIEKGSILEEIYGKTEIRINSFHHQAVKDPGKDIEIIAKSADGVPEAIVQKNHPFSVAVQWHPEMMYDSEEQLKLLKAFVDACR
ncbi:MAG: gamma-glutamyl-gamma-aminobutyrate hydrolase family protein [Clostridiales bacterium]|nr:gamma-glutamyl-gamma-aminobutyrate hydrolase family protein [Clostridiales bacterium]